MKNRQALLSTLLMVANVLLAFAAGYLLHARLVYGDFPTFRQAYELLNGQALRPLPPAETLERAMIRGAINAVGDPHTYLNDPPQAELQQNTLAGRYGGIGVTYNRDAAGQYILLPIPGGPAEQAGLLEGDLLLGYDELEIGPQTTLDDVQAAERGPVDSSVVVRTQRGPDGAAQSATLRRAETALPSVSAYLDPAEPRLGVIKINVVADSTPGEVTAAAASLAERGATALALDLRDNSGGLLLAGIETARLFLTDGVVIAQQYRDKPVERFEVEKPGPLADIPLVVLMNQNSASAAEIIAGALQANGRARLIGQPSYGKNTIQLVNELRDRSSLHITAAEWWLEGPDGLRLPRPQPNQGLLPDIESQTGGSPDPALNSARQALFGP